MSNLLTRAYLLHSLSHGEGMPSALWLSRVYYKDDTGVMHRLYISGVSLTVCTSDVIPSGCALVAPQFLITIDKDSHGKHHVGLVVSGKLNGFELPPDVELPIGVPSIPQGTKIVSYFPQLDYGKDGRVSTHRFCAALGEHLDARRPTFGAEDLMAALPPLLRPTPSAKKAKHNAPKTA